MSGPVPTVSPELKVLMRRLRLGRLLDTLPERLALARSHDLTHAQFLEQLFSDGLTRRDIDSKGLRARAAKVDPSMVLEAWDDAAKITYDKAIWGEPVSMLGVPGHRGSASSPAGVASVCTSNGPTRCTYLRARPRPSPRTAPGGGTRPQPHAVSSTVSGRGVKT